MGGSGARVSVRWWPWRTRTVSVQLFEGACEGMVAYEPRGDKGFGYDPIFYIPKPWQAHG